MRSVLARYLRLARRRAGTAAHRGLLAVHPRPRAVDAERALADLPPDPHVLVLCFGNICRSPMAERYLRRAVDERGIGSVSVDSAGFFETEGRSSPPEAVEAAAAFGVDLEPHESARVTAADIERSDLVLLMDAFNRYQFRRAFDAPAYYLGAFGDCSGRDVEISDPYGRDVERFRSVYGEIASATDALVERLG